ncbi:hypothetical protein CRE_07710 [Caenorhabditis remanei]|uniref:Uncharacterized protein n=1 Tax=Caenorhabditis remanei TaxID=31234 RepID=E3MZS4_CAERE|nr:hypothetical protein CRE_07710 [Caenorhabditis remanei]
MQILLFILFLLKFTYCKPNGNQDCFRLKDTFEYTDTENVRRKYVGGCCTPECLALLGTTDSLTWSKTSSIDTFISTLYKEECCNDDSLAIATNETSTPTTVTSSISTTPSLTSTTDTTTSITATSPGACHVTSALTSLMEKIHSHRTLKETLDWLDPKASQNSIF